MKKLFSFLGFFIVFHFSRGQSETPHFKTKVFQIGFDSLVMQKKKVDFLVFSAQKNVTAVNNYAKEWSEVWHWYYQAPNHLDSLLRYFGQLEIDKGRMFTNLNRIDEELAIFDELRFRVADRFEALQGEALRKKGSDSAVVNEDFNEFTERYETLGNWAGEVISSKTSLLFAIDTALLSKLNADFKSFTHDGVR